LGRVLIPSSAGLSGLHITQEPLIRVDPLAYILGATTGVAEPSSIQVHRDFGSIECLARLYFLEVGESVV
jgi:hypothetical protein